eukprot:5357458-Pyramimonas_sp.AAC.1
MTALMACPRVCCVVLLVHGVLGAAATGEALLPPPRPHPPLPTLARPTPANPSRLNLLCGKRAGPRTIQRDRP